MSSVLMGATPTHLWQQAVKAAEVSACARLNEALESYLVFLLMRFSRDAGLSEGTSVAYFIDLGQSAYGHLGTLRTGLCGHMYADLAQAFISLTDVLQALRPRTAADLLADLELLQRDSQSARRRLAALWDVSQVQRSPDRPQ